MAGITMHALMEEDGLFLQYMALWITFQLIADHWFRKNEKIVVKQLSGEN
jgi:succinate-acetate transporter protein